MRTILLAVRHLSRRPVYSVINIGGLALSLAGCLFIFYFVYDEFTYDRFHTKADRIYRITQLFITKENTQNLLWTSQKIGPYLERNYPQVEKSVRMEDVTASFQGRGTEEHGIVKADPAILDVFSFPLLEGNPQEALAHGRSIILSETLSTKYFRGHAMGQEVDIDGEAYTVTGIMRDVPTNSDKFITGIASGDFGGEGDSTLYFTYQTYILLYEGENPEYIRGELGKLSDVLHRKNDSEVKFGYDMQALTELHFFTGTGMDNPKGSKTNTLILGGVAIVLLLVSLFNFINLTTIVSFGRVREIGIRKTSGAQISELVRQFMIESMTLVVLASAIAFVIFGAFHSLFEIVSGKVISLNNTPQLAVLAVMALLLAATTLIASIYPAWAVSKLKPVHALKNEQLDTTQGPRIRKTLTIVQFAVSSGLLVFLFAVLAQTEFMRNADPGFTKEKVIVIKLPNDPSIQERGALFVDEFQSLAGVAEVGLGGFASVPGTTDVTASPIGITVDGEPRDPIVTNITADKHYTSILSLNAISGVTFHQIDAPSVVGKALINEAFAYSSGWTNPLGETIRTYAGNATVVGIIPDFHFKSLHNTIEPMVIMGLDESKPDVHYLFLKMTTNNLDPLRSKWQQLMPNHPFEYSFLNDYFDRQYESEKTMELVFLCFTVLTITIAGSGLFALAWHHVSKKVKEISIRKVMGASQRSLVVLLSRQFFGLVLIGILLGSIGGSWLAREWLAGFAYRTDETLKIIVLPIILSITTAALVLVAKTYAGARRNPVEGLRQE